MPDGPAFTVDQRTLAVRAPQALTDDQADALLRQVGRVLDQTERYLRARLADLHPDLSLASHEQEEA